MSGADYAYFSIVSADDGLGAGVGAGGCVRTRRACAGAGARAPASWTH